MRPVDDTDVARAFEACPAPARARLLALRELIFRTAAETPGVGALEETLKWGEPAYLTTASKSGSTIRIGWKKPHATRYAIYFNCQTALVETFRTLFPGEFRFEGNRAIVFDVADPVADAVPADALALCIAAALTHHRPKNGRLDKLR